MVCSATAQNPCTNFWLKPQFWWRTRKWGEIDLEVFADCLMGLTSYWGVFIVLCGWVKQKWGGLGGSLHVTWLVECFMRNCVVGCMWLNELVNEWLKRGFRFLFFHRHVSCRVFGIVETLFDCCMWWVGIGKAWMLAIVSCCWRGGREKWEGKSEFSDV
jgi:hypothetical protein